MTTPARRPRLTARTGLGIGAVALGVVGATSIAVAMTHADPQPGQAHLIPAAASTAVASTTPAARPATAGAKPARAPATRAAASPAAELGESAPVRIRISSIGVDARFTDLGLTGTGQLAVPSDPAVAGWFTGAHTPGAPGVSVVAGHVTWNGAKAAFFGLGRLNRGDRVLVDREDGSRATFAVQRMSTFPKDTFPTREVYRTSASPQLVLITCGGTYNHAAHHYDSNVIAWASLVTARPGHA